MASLADLFDEGDNAGGVIDTKAPAAVGVSRSENKKKKSEKKKKSATGATRRKNGNRVVWKSPIDDRSSSREDDSDDEDDNDDEDEFGDNSDENDEFGEDQKADDDEMSDADGADDDDTPMECDEFSGKPSNTRVVRKQSAARSRTSSTGGSSGGSKSTGLSKRPKDVFIVRKEEEKSVEKSSVVFESGTGAGKSVGVKANGGNDGGGGDTHAIDSYQETQRFLVEGMIKAGDITQSSREKEQEAKQVACAVHAAQNKRMGLTGACLVNHAIRVVDSARSLGGGVTALGSTPYTNAFNDNFIRRVVERAPQIEDTVVPDEVRVRSQAVSRAHIEASYSSAPPSRGQDIHPRDTPCARGKDCWTMELYDENNQRLPATVSRVFWFPSELSEMTTQPRKFKDEARKRLCIGCKILQANEFTVNVQARGNEVEPFALCADFHVLVNVAGQYPVMGTIGRGSNGYAGLVGNVPRASRLGWVAKPAELPGCFQYIQVSMPPYPIPQTFYQRDLRQMKMVEDRVVALNFSQYAERRRANMGVHGTGTGATTTTSTGSGTEKTNGIRNKHGPALAKQSGF